MPADTIPFATFRSQVPEGLAEALQQIKMNKALIKQKEAEAAMPFGGKMPSGDVGEAYWATVIQNKFGKDSPEGIAVAEAMKNKNQRNQSLSDWREQLSRSLGYKMMPADSKKQANAMAVGMGFDPAEATNLLSQGYTLNDLAKAKGVNLKEVTPIQPLQGEEIKQLRQRQGFVNEISAFENEINQAIEPYGRKLFGYSPALIKDSLLGLNEEQQAKFLAANALQPELAALRMKAAGGQVGIGAIEEMQEAAMSKFKQFEGSISPRVRTMMNKEMSRMIKKASAAYDNYVKESAGIGGGKKRRRWDAEKGRLVDAT